MQRVTSESFASIVSSYTRQKCEIAIADLMPEYISQEYSVEISKFGEYEYRVCYPLVILVKQDRALLPRLLDMIHRLSDAVDLMKLTAHKIYTTPTESVETASDCIAELNANIDELVLGGTPSMLRKFDVSAKESRIIINEMSAAIRFYNGINKSRQNDAFIEEAYSNITPTTINKITKYIGACMRVYDKVRSKSTKKVNLLTQTSKIKYKPVDDITGLKSIAPAYIIGAKVLWAFDVERRTLVQYVAAVGEKLSVSGTTITGYCPEKSTRKSVKNPMTVLALFSESTPTSDVVLSVFNTIRSKKLQLTTGRTNSNMIFLCVK
jgi:hypothetical protein